MSAKGVKGVMLKDPDGNSMAFAEGATPELGT